MRRTQNCVMLESCECGGEGGIGGWVEVGGDIIWLLFMSICLG